MSFLAPAALGLFAVLWAGHWALPHRWRLPWLWLGSLVLYGWVHPWFVVVLLLSAQVAHGAGWWVARVPRLARAGLVVSAVAQLGLLATFKYVDFLVVELQAALAMIGADVSLQTLGWVAPLGLSFYTFQALSYPIDVARGRVAARMGWAGWLQVHAFVAFAPQLVAGPIERAGHLLPQLVAERRLAVDDLRAGLSLIVWGAVQKVVVADSLAPYVDAAFRAAEPGGMLLWAGVVGFMVQVYADLSGYTDLARGLARLLGITLVRNFDRPWRAVSPGDFWGRWHQSMTRWVRDYVLTPLLGAPPVSTARWAVATTVTLLLLGVWHGAGWNYVLFGALHAAAFLAWAALGRWLGRAEASVGLARGAWWLVTMGGLGTVGALVFREPDAGRLVGHLSRAPWAASDVEQAAAAVVWGTTLVAAAVLVGGRAYNRALRHRWSTLWGLPLWSTGCAIGAVAAWLLSGESPVDFLYFQF